MPNENEDIATALNMYANWIETRDPLLSKRDVEQQARTREPALMKKLAALPELSDDVVTRIARLRKLAERHQRIGAS